MIGADITGNSLQQTVVAANFVAVLDRMSRAMRGFAVNCAFKRQAGVPVGSSALRFILMFKTLLLILDRL